MQMFVCVQNSNMYNRELNLHTHLSVELLFFASAFVSNWNRHLSILNLFVDKNSNLSVNGL